MSKPFTPSWLAGEPTAAGFIPLDFRDPADRAQALRDAARCGSHPSLVARIPALADPGATAVVTGQQVGLFGGPLYSLYKAATAVRLARRFADETGAPCVPVFWLQTEDHDFDEIRRAWVPNADGPACLALAPRESDAPVPVRAVTLGAEVDSLVAQLAELLDGLPFTDEVVSLVSSHYRSGATLTGAFAGLMTELLGPAGLVVLDPSDPELVTAAAPLHRAAFQRAPEIAAALIARSEALDSAGYHVMVHVRDGAPLSFWHPDGPDGPRFRLEPDGPDRPDRWRLCGTGRTVSRARVAQDLDARPERFSTSALLRPLLQDAWLPTAAYVGGPGECAYFAQLQPLYHALDRPMPLVVPRARFTLLDATSRRLAEQLGLEPADATRPRPDLLLRTPRQIPLGAPDPAALRASLATALESTLDGFQPIADALDPGLAKATTKAAGAITAQVDRLVERYGRTLAARDTVATARLDRFCALLAPGGAPQERVYGFAPFAARVGVRALVEAVLSAAEPLRVTPEELNL